jgi:hypothetical protein
LKRLIKVLATAALMVVLMATTVSPAFAKQEETQGHGFGVKQEGTPKVLGWCNPEQDPYTLKFNCDAQRPA